MDGKCWINADLRWLLLLGSNQNDEDDLAKQWELIRRCRNDREGDLANIRCLIQLCPNGHAVSLVRSLEHVHRLVGSYRFFIDSFLLSEVLALQKGSCLFKSLYHSFLPVVQQLKLADMGGLMQ